jgi:hypothetical protein
MLRVKLMTFLMAGMFVLAKAERDINSVCSKRGTGYKCPDTKSIEVTYAESCKSIQQKWFLWQTLNIQRQ